MKYYRVLSGYRRAAIIPEGADEVSKEEYENAICKITRSNGNCLRSLTVQDVIEMLIPKQINTLPVDDNTALRMRQFYPTFASVVGQTVKQGFKFTYADKLWKTIQPDLTIQAHYPPGAGTESLYEEVCEIHEGTMDDPIPYNGNMALENGKYYIQDWVIYLCIRDTGNPVYHALSTLVGLYVEVAE
jgi:hypothetical protein